MDRLSKASHDYKLNLWISRIQECRESGKSVAVWCKENNLNDKSYYYWLRKIRLETFDSLPAERKPRPVTTATEQLPVFAQVPTDFMEPHQCAAVVIRIHGATLEIQNSASDTVIENTLRAMKYLC